MAKRTRQTKSKERAPRASEKRLLKYLAPYWKLFAIGLTCTLVVSGIEVYFVILIRDVVGAAIEGARSGDASRLNQIALLIVGVHLVKWIFAYGQWYFVSSGTYRVAVHLRNDLFTHLQTLTLSYFERTKIGHIMSRMTNDIGYIQTSPQYIISLFHAPLVCIGATVLIFKMNWVLALVSLILLPSMSITIIRLSRGMRNLSELLQIKLADVASIVQETLSGVRIVKSFSMEDHEVSRFNAENQQTYKSAMRAVRRSSAISPTVEFIGISGMAFVLWFGGNMVVGNTMFSHMVSSFETDALIAFLFALERIGNSAKTIARLNAPYHQIMAGATRVFDVLDEVPDITDAPDAVTMQPIEGHVEFKNVSFSYNSDQRVLNNVSLVVEPGQQVAIVGPSGAGKSTIANLIPRFYDVESGSVLVDGIDVRDVTFNSLRKQIAIVPQETILFSSTVKENVAYGWITATDEDIEEAAKAANAHDFICNLAEGYDTVVGERGVKLSGGERQRVSIARALLKNPKLLILDEATSSLDTTSEAIVQEALERLMRDRTTLVIAHRLSTIVNSDKILVMKSGRIVETGTHQELLDLSGLYAKLYNMQIRGGTDGERKR